MVILTVNAGSSSIRLDAFVKKAGGLEKLGGSKYPPEGGLLPLLETFLRDNSIADVSLVAHRVVHGGTMLVDSCFISPSVEKEIDRLSVLAPLHNPFALRWIQACRAVFNTGVPQVAVFDTAVYSSLPEVASAYALPADLCGKYEIRRYGFHGLAHSAMLGRWKELCPGSKGGGKVISLQLGAGCSISAFHDGKAMDTSMGFSPLEGLVMATRPGDIDPQIILHLQDSCGLSPEEIRGVLNHSSGLLGVSGISGDMQALLESGHDRARLAIELYCYRARKYTGAYLAVLQGAEAVLFGGGVGENSPQVRSRILEDMQWLGIDLDSEANSAVIGNEGRISSPGSRTAVWVIPVDEASVLAREAIKVIGTT